MMMTCQSCGEKVKPKDMHDEFGCVRCAKTELREGLVSSRSSWDVSFLWWS